MRRFAVLLLAGGLCLTALAGCASTRDADAEAYGDDDLGSSTTVTPDAADKATAVTLADLLRGRVAGVQVDEVPGGISVRIRGAGPGSAEPLYVLDGVPMSANPGGILHVNPNDIQTITILKGPETALYGSRGANGVIVVRTKSGG